MVKEILAQGIEQGALRPDLNLDLAAESLLGMLRGVNFYRDENVSLHDAVASSVGIFLQGCSH